MWIEINENDYDNLPQEKMPVLLGENSSNAIRYWLGYCETNPANSDLGKLCWYNWNDNNEQIYPTHWMSLPKLPE